eukprot:88315_1
MLAITANTTNTTKIQANVTGIAVELDLSFAFCHLSSLSSVGSFVNCHGSKISIRITWKPLYSCNRLPFPIFSFNLSFILLFNASLKRLDSNVSINQFSYCSNASSAAIEKTEMETNRPSSELLFPPSDRQL